MYSVQKLQPRDKAEHVEERESTGRRPKGSVTQNLINSIEAHVCIVDRDGVVTSVNETWSDFARENDYPIVPRGVDRFGVGENYFDVCARADGCDAGEAAEVARGLRNVIDGRLPRFVLEYPCHSPAERRWFRLVISPLRGRYEGAVLSHYNIGREIATATELSRLSRERDASTTELSRLSAEFEDRVQYRTEHLELANRELEAFTSAVSHDLRAPLRAIDSFASILKEDYGATLDDEGKKYLHRIIANAQRMKDLIEDLLGLSKIGASSMRIARTNVSALVRTIADELRRSEPDREVEFRIVPDVLADCDPDLVTLVLENLLGNAWKFTRGADNPCISFTGVRAGRSTVCSVSDNGAGFEMAYADRLFLPFQRLHSVLQFEGHGIGLATVRRIVERHGGTVSAEGAPGKGATFTFTLPDRSPATDEESAGGEAPSGGTTDDG